MHERIYRLNETLKRQIQYIQQFIKENTYQSKLLFGRVVDLFRVLCYAIQTHINGLAYVCAPCTHTKYNKLNEKLNAFRELRGVARPRCCCRCSRSAYCIHSHDYKSAEAGYNVNIIMFAVILCLSLSLSLLFHSSRFQTVFVAIYILYPSFIIFYDYTVTCSSKAHTHKRLLIQSQICATCSVLIVRATRIRSKQDN